MRILNLPPRATHGAAPAHSRAGLLPSDAMRRGTPEGVRRHTCAYAVTTPRDLRAPC